ncbi:dihydroneopterin aldolase [Hyphococcus sp.]|uniref:dihydroneopterin aldolase n=1 Tax=Hyphococcus sp. TaxID=2038636 RepID=UPI0035C77770
MSKPKTPPQKTQPEITPLPRSATAPQRRIFVRGLTLDAYIGAYESEQGVTQPIRIDFEADVIEPANPVSDELEDIVCYDEMTRGIKAIIAEGHIKLVETLAERIADLVLSHPMVISVMVRIVKPNAITEADAAGVEISRTKR